MADRAGWQRTLESELRAAGRELAVPPAGDLTSAVRQRLEGRAVRRRRRPAWRVGLAVVVTLLAVLIATPQGRAVISHAFRFAGVEFRQEPGPVRPRGTSTSMYGDQRVSLQQARRRASFPILVPAALGLPGQVVAGDGGRVVSLIYPRTRYGLLRIDEFAGHLDRILFLKIVAFRDMTRVEVNGRQALWIKDPHVLMYIAPDGVTATAPARLTTGNTLFWDTGRVALRLEGRLSRAAALAIASSTR